MFFQKSVDMRLERAGCSGLRVGPPQVAPKMLKKRGRNPTRFRSSFLVENTAQSEPNGLPNGLQNGTNIVKLGALFRELLRKGSWGLIWEAFGSILGCFWEHFGSLLDDMFS